MDNSIMRFIAVVVIIIAIGYIILGTPSGKRLVSAKPDEVNSAFDMLEDFADDKPVTFYKEEVPNDTESEQ